MTDSQSAALSDGIYFLTDLIAIKKKAYAFFQTVDKARPKTEGWAFLMLKMIALVEI